MADYLLPRSAFFAARLGLRLPSILPIQLAFEWLGTRISDNPLARRIDRCTSTKQVSLLRITYGLVMFCGLIACVLALAYGWRFLQAYLGW